MNEIKEEIQKIHIPLLINNKVVALAIKLFKNAYSVIPQSGAILQ